MLQACPTISGVAQPRRAALTVRRGAGRQHVRRHVVPRAAAAAQGPQEPHQPVAPGLLRRETLASAAALALGASLAQPAPVRAEECTLVAAPNGLQFCELVEGTGDAPTAGSMIRAHYTGRLASNGAVFDSSYDRGRPLQFKIGVGQVIKGWDQGILGTEGVPPMKAGGKRKLIIPPELGYGQRGAGGVIPPNATLEFLVELLPPRR